MHWLLQFGAGVSKWEWPGIVSVERRHATCTCSQDLSLSLSVDSCRIGLSLMIMPWIKSSTNGV